MTYQWADEFDNTAGLADVSPQPQSEGVLDSVVVYAISGEAYPDGVQYAVWRYSMVTPDQLATLYTALGLTTAYYNEGTVKTNAGGNRTTFTNYNAIVLKPLNPKFKFGFYRDVEFIVRLVEVL